MSTAAFPPPARIRLLQSAMRVTVEQFQRMIETGIVPEDATKELLDGVIVPKDRGNLGDNSMGHSPQHRLAIRKLMFLATRIESGDHHMQIQLPIVLSDISAPEPDGAIVMGTDADYGDRLPSAADATCVIEAAHSSLERDTETKLPLYAAAGISQYLVVDLRENRVEVHVDPDRQAETYRSNTIVVKGQPIVLNLGGGQALTIDAGEILP
ncbi:MAG: Uma2 family endonuclease [Tepidisphaeraceae bacterium]|jgi:hypothetical protein